MKYIFGPVNSRRLGISLGVDLVPHKTCSMNCVYCECGPTTELTSEIREYVPVQDVLAELDGFLSKRPILDAVTFSGSGEPTLHSGIGTVIRHIRKSFPEYRIAVLTNGSLLWKREVRKSLREAHVVIPSLDAVSERVFSAIARPAPGIDAGRVVDGIARFRREFSGILIIEIFIIPGLNDTFEEISLIKEACRRIGPDSIHLNTLDRPGTEDWVAPATGERLEQVKGYFDPLPAEIVGSPKNRGRGTGGLSENAILATLRRRPSTLDDLRILLGAGRDEIMMKLDELRAAGHIISERGKRGEFFRVRDHGR